MDRLTLRIENRSDDDSDLPGHITVAGKGVTIGRKTDNDLVLPDNTRFISGRHVSIRAEGERYLLDDVSTNGTFINGSATRIDGTHRLRTGDTIRIGSYIIAVSVSPIEVSAKPQISGAQRVQAPPMAGTMKPPTTGIQQRHASTTTTGGRGAQTPDFSRFQTGSTGAPGVQRPTGGVSLPPMMVPKPAESQIPDDFDDDLLGPIPAQRQDDGARVPPGDPYVAPPPPARATAPQPAPDLEPAPVPVPHAEPQHEYRDPVPAASVAAAAYIPDPDAAPFGPVPVSVPIPTRSRTSGPFSQDDPTPAPASVPFEAAKPASKTAPVAEKTDMTPHGLGERFAETAAPKSLPRAPEPSAAAHTPAAAPAPAEPVINDLLEGFLQGAGIGDPDALAIPLRELGVMLGRCARLGTQEMMQMLQDRSAVKLFVAQEDRTMRIASGNNPMKFMIDPDEAFTALFVKPRDGYQTGPDGFDNALTDIRQHQTAMMAAIQPALADMLEGLAPSEIAEESGGGMLGGGARKSWEEYTKRWNSRAAQGENGMLDAFLDAFARRYNQALHSSR